MIEKIEKSVYTALLHYSNVHRGSGLFSKITTHLFEKSRDIILGYLGLDRKKYILVYCSSRRAAQLTRLLKESDYRKISSSEFGLAIGVTAVAIKRNAMPSGPPEESGGGTTRLVAPE